MYTSGDFTEYFNGEYNKKGIPIMLAETTVLPYSAKISRNFNCSRKYLKEKFLTRGVQCARAAN